MKARRALALLFVLLAASTTIGWVVAATYWGEAPVDLRSESGNAFLVLVGFVGDPEEMKKEMRLPLSENRRDDIVKALTEWLPLALRESAAQSRAIPRAIGSKTTVLGLCIAWEGDVCAFEYADGTTYSCSSVLPGAVESGENEGGMRIAGIHCALSFAGEVIASAVISLYLDAWPWDQSDPAWTIDTRYFWSDARVVYPLGSGSTLRGLTVQLEPADSERGGAPASQLPDSLNGLADCVEQHLQAFVLNEFGDVLSDAKLDGQLQDIALCAFRECKITGEIIKDCAMRHYIYSNGRILSGPPQSIPAVNGHLCYSVFGF